MGYSRVDGQDTNIGAGYVDGTDAASIGEERAQAVLEQLNSWNSACKSFDISRGLIKLDGDLDETFVIVCANRRPTENEMAILAATYIEEIGSHQVEFVVEGAVAGQKVLERYGRVNSKVVSTEA